jgi:hypothetical protein
MALNGPSFSFFVFISVLVILATWLSHEKLIGCQRSMMMAHLYAHVREAAPAGDDCPARFSSP